MNSNTNANANIPNNAISNDSGCSNTRCCPPKSPAINSMPKVGRNDACPCGNGKKFKKCCGQYV